MADDFRVLVCGGQDFEEREYLFAVMDSIHADRTIDLIVHGAAVGAEILGEEWARRNGVPTVGVPGQWARYGKRARPIRNAEMLNIGIDLVVAFTGGGETADMIRKARACGVEVREC